MCGITGIWNRGDRPIDRDELWAMTRAAAHRGPDGEGIYIDGRLGLGHRRLSIIDLSDAGRQPMQDATGRFCITYNGEIYNYRELRAELVERRHRFASQTDTEVLLHAYLEWGAGCLDRLNGMFAFAVWDAQRRQLFCARDRFGIKPFYYLDASDRFLFGSEIKQIRAARGVSPPPDRARLATFLASGATDDGEASFFEGVRLLRPGHWLRVDAGGLEVGRWWRLPEPPDAPTASASDDAAARVLEVLTDAVRLRLRADVPVGSCLSGGVDSNAVLCLMSRLLGGSAHGDAPPLESFSAVFTDPRLDESRYHSAGRERAGARWHSILCAGDVVREALPAVMRAHDEPFHSTGSVAQYLVNRLARQHGVPVLLNGQGSDEIFAGYHGFFGPILADLVRTGRLRGLARELRAMHGLHGHRWAYLARLGLRSLVAPHAAALRRPLRRRAAPAWLSAGLRDRLPAPEPVERRHAPAMYRAHETALGSISMPAYLRHEDRNSMASSIESRLPFLDYRLVSMAVSLPNPAKVRDGWTKKVLRDALRDVVPDTVLDRRDKMGFPTPQVAWLRGELRDVVDDAMQDAALRRFGAVDVGAVRAMYRAWLGGHDALSSAIWRVTAVDFWARTCGV